VLPLRVLNLGTRDPKDALAMAVDEPNFDILDAYIRADVDRKIMEQNRDLVFDLVENFNSESEVTNKYTEVGELKVWKPNQINLSQEGPMLFLLLTNMGPSS
jgi:hypothetical protein